MIEPNDEARLVDAHVDKAPNGPTEDDECRVLEQLGYLLNAETGVYEGEPNGDE